MSKRTRLKEEGHSEDLQEIISKPPSWLLKRGTSVVFIIIFLILGLSYFIKYPERVYTELRFTTTNSPKIIISQDNAIFAKLLAEDGDLLSKGDIVAYMESTADHTQVISLLEKLKQLRGSVLSFEELTLVIPPDSLDLGELQVSYQAFYLAYINFRAINRGGIFEKRKGALHHEVNYVNAQNERILETFELQKMELTLAEEEFEKFKQLAERKIISPLELQQKEAILLAKRQAIPQMESNIIANRSNLLSKNREISEVENQVLEEERKFVQALNSFVSEAEIWKKKYVLLAPVTGRLVYAGFWQENQHVIAGAELFYINPGRDDYYGEAFIPQIAISKINTGQNVLIKVKGYPYQEYGFLRGRVDYVSDIPIKDSLFFSKISLHRVNADSLIKLKPGILADAEIITDDQSIFYRIWRNLTKNLRFNGS